MKKDIGKDNDINKDFGSINDLGKSKGSKKGGEYVFDEDMSDIYDEVEKNKISKERDLEDEQKKNEDLAVGHSSDKDNKEEISKTSAKKDSVSSEDILSSEEDYLGDNVVRGNKKKIGIIASSIVLAVLVGGVGYLSYQVSSDKILKNTYISSINVGDLTKAQALDKIKGSKELSSIIIQYGDKKWDTPISDLKVNIKYDEMVNDAFEKNRSNGFLSNLVTTLKGDFGSKTNVGVKMDYDNATLKSKVEAIKKELDSRVKNATLTLDDDGNVVVVKEEAGREVNVEKNVSLIANNIKSGKLSTTLDVKLDEPKIKSDVFKGIDTMLSSYSTVFGGLSGRDYNIIKSTNDSGGMLLKPGEEYSFNKITGEKTIANGYRTAPVIESGKLVTGIGGGVCQTSSTIFNAALLSGMEITERRSHSIPSDYVKMGRDATVYDGNPGQDFKFKNPFKHNVYVKNFISGNKLVSQIFGAKEDKQNIDIATELLSSYSLGSKVINDPSLPAGKRVVKEYSRPGYKVVTYRIYKDANGKTIKTENIGYSNYPARAGVVRVGSAKAPAVKTPSATGQSTQGTGAATGAGSATTTQ